MKPGGTSRFIGFCAVLAAVSLLPGCGPTTSRKGIVAYDFIESFPLSESRHEVTFIDFGTPTARPHLRSGWSTDEGSGNASWVWSLGRESVLEFFLHEPRELPVTFRCFPFQFPGSPPQRISIAVNGVDLQTVRLLDGSKPYQIILPAVALKTGKNQLQFRYAYSRSAIAVMPDSVGQRILSKVTLQVSQAIPSYPGGTRIPIPHGWRRAQRQAIAHCRISAIPGLDRTSYCSSIAGPPMSSGPRSASGRGSFSLSGMRPRESRPLPIINTDPSWT